MLQVQHDEDVVGKFERANVNDYWLPVSTLLHYLNVFTASIVSTRVKSNMTR